MGSFGRGLLDGGFLGVEEDLRAMAPPPTSVLPGGAVRRPASLADHGSGPSECFLPWPLTGTSTATTTPMMARVSSNRQLRRSAPRSRSAPWLSHSLPNVECDNTLRPVVLNSTNTTFWQVEQVEQVEGPTEAGPGSGASEYPWTILNIEDDAATPFSYSPWHLRPRSGRSTGRSPEFGCAMVSSATWGMLGVAEMAHPKPRN